MRVFDRYFPLGMGTSRFPINGPDDTQGIERSIDFVSAALECGVNYIDTSYTYSAGMAQKVLKEAFIRTKCAADVTVKVMHDMDKTADDARRRVELQLNAMGLDKAAFFTCWTIFSYDVFKDIMRKGGVYEGALRLKDEGIVDHICFSTHAQPSEIIRIIESDAFEGVTLSYSIINSVQMQPVLDKALEHNLGVAIMNPLGGGVIAQNQEFFEFACAEGEKSTISAAIRYVKAHPAVNIVLSGISTINELLENAEVFTGENPETDENRLVRVGAQISELKNFCTGCNYCTGCPAEIPISEIMKKRNTLLFKSSQAYNRTNPELVKNIKLFYTHVSAKEWFPETAENPCVSCGQCEEKCTQKLKIINAIADTYERADKVGFSLVAHKDRIEELLVNKNYSKVGIYPNGGFANLVVDLYEQFFGNPSFEWIQFNSDPKMWGEMSGGIRINSPDEIEKIHPDIIIIGTYKYDDEIYKGLQCYESKGIVIEKLHRSNDVPWVF